MTTWRCPLPDAEATERLGVRLAEAARAGDVLLLVGDLGAGKTTLARGLGRGLGVREPVTSPTFALHHVYAGRLRFDHLDLYRLGPAEIEAAGLSDAWEDGRGLCAIEWPERLVGDGLDLRPADPLTLTLETTPDDGRVAVFTAASGGRAAAWLEAVAVAGPVG